LELLVRHGQKERHERKEGRDGKQAGKAGKGKAIPITNATHCWMISFCIPMRGTTLYEQGKGGGEGKEYTYVVRCYRRRRKLF